MRPEVLPFVDHCLAISSALKSPLQGPDDQPLPIEIAIRFGHVLVMRSDLAGHRHREELIESLLAPLHSFTAGKIDGQLLAPYGLGRSRTPWLQTCVQARRCFRCRV